MTGTDRHETHPGYWPSAWPVECAGNRRQKARSGRLDAATGAANVVSRKSSLWYVMAVERDPGQWFVGGTTPAFSGPAPFGWVHRVDSATLEPLAESPPLPCGDHVWCGALLAHANGAIYNVNGSFVHRLDPDSLEVTGERQLVDRSHNGLLALSDGTLITKDLRLEGRGPTTLTRLDPDTLDTIGEPLVLPEGSMGRIAADRDGDRDLVYVPGTEHLWRIEVDGEDLFLDDWCPRYRESDGPGGISWDVCLANDRVWLMDCGDVAAVRAIHSRSPNGRFETPPGNLLSWRQEAPWTAPVRLLEVGVGEGDIRSVEPFGFSGGGVIAPPVAVPEYEICVTWDSINGGLAGVTTGASELSVAWHLDVRPTMQPVVFPDSGELVINDFTDAGHDDLIVVDLATGHLLDRVDTGSRIANGMFLSAGAERDILYCSTTTIAWIQWL